MLYANDYNNFWNGLGLGGFFWAIIIIVIIVILTRKKHGNNQIEGGEMTQAPVSEKTNSESSNSVWLMLLIMLMTIIFTEELVNMFFPAESAYSQGTVRIIAKLVVDAVLVAVGLVIHRKVIAKAIFYSGIIRFVILIPFFLTGIDRTMRTIFMFIIVIFLIIVGAKKFSEGANESNTKEVK